MWDSQHLESRTVRDLKRKYHSSLRVFRKFLSEALKRELSRPRTKEVLVFLDNPRRISDVQRISNNMSERRSKKEKEIVNEYENHLRGKF